MAHFTHNYNLHLESFKLKCKNAAGFFKFVEDFFGELFSDYAKILV